MPIWHLVSAFHFHWRDPISGVLRLRISRYGTHYLPSLVAALCLLYRYFKFIFFSIFSRCIFSLYFSQLFSLLALPYPYSCAHFRLISAPFSGIHRPTSCFFIKMGRKRSIADAKVRVFLFSIFISFLLFAFPFYPFILLSA